MSRGFATFAILTIIFGILSSLMVFIGLNLIKGLTYLTKMVPEHVNLLADDFQTFFFIKLLPAWEHLTHLYNELSPSDQQAIQHNIHNIGEKSAEILNGIGSHLINGLSHFIISLPNTLTSTILIFLATFFISKDWNRIGAFILASATPKIDEHLKAVYRELKKAFIGRFIHAQFILVSITTIIVFFGLLLLRVEHPLTIALISGIVDLMPYLGTSAVFIPWITYHFFAQNYMLTIGLSTLFALVIIQRQLTEPKILSSNIGLDPLATLISLFVGFKIFGFTGLILGPISLVILKTLFQARVFHDIWLYIAGKPEK
ncbi:sporulation integral membrane protein YtvI [Terrilactibacillus sp. S3-3]|nr:sporulation integral membrane protein YtvI [Terrilactibacillus sp. S3-3]